MSTAEIQKKDGMLSLRIEGCELKIPFTPSNQKVLIILARSLKEEDSEKNCFTFQQISEALDHESRQWSNNFYREFEAADEDMLNFLKREFSLQDKWLNLIHTQILENPFLSIPKHHKIFLEKHPDCSLTEVTFREYVRKIDSSKLLQQIRRLVNTETGELDDKFYLQEILQQVPLTSAGHAEITELFPEVQEELSSNESPTLNLEDALPNSRGQKAKLSTFLYGCGLPLQVLAMLFFVSKSTIHHWIYSFATSGLEEKILDSIDYWSGQIAVDEKWIKIDGAWWYVFSAVDAVTGFPLLIRLYPHDNALSWQLFFTQFKALYGIPLLIISDGSSSLAAGKKKVFLKVKHQLCKFHKLRNLFKCIFKHVRETALLKRFLRLAKHIFSNKYVSSRKYAAKTLARIAPEPVKEYIENNILKYWRQLTYSLTSNAAERFNRKIKKCLSGRYGLKSEQTVQILLRALWYKECVMRGQQHLDSLEDFSAENLAQICQENLLNPENLHFLELDEEETSRKAA